MLTSSEKQMFLRCLVEGITILSDDVSEFMFNLRRTFSFELNHDFDAVLSGDKITYYTKHGFPLICTIAIEDKLEFRQVEDIKSLDADIVSEVGGAVLNIISALVKMNETGIFKSILPKPVFVQDEETFEHDDEFGGI